jgi:hypothetical protein
LGKDSNRIYQRLRLGWKPEDALMLPIDITHKYNK